MMPLTIPALPSGPSQRRATTSLEPTAMPGHPVPPVHPVNLFLEHEDLTGAIIGCAMTVHRTLGSGFLESVYRNALAIEFRKRGLPFDRERRIRVWYGDEPIGDYSADFLVDGSVVVEAKAIRALARQDEAQLVHYLTATHIDIGLLLNFGSERLEFKRKTRVYRPAGSLTDQRL